MRIEREIRFASKLFFSGWGNFYTFSSFLLFPAAVLFAPSWWESNRFRIALGCIVVLLSFTVKVICQAFTYFDSFYHPIRAIRIVAGEGLYNGSNLVVLETNPFIEPQTLLALFCSSSGAVQPLGILKVLSNSSASAEMMTVEIAPIADLAKYFHEKSRLDGLYALPLIKDVYLGAIQNAQ